MAGKPYRLVGVQGIRILDVAAVAGAAAYAFCAAWLLVASVPAPVYWAVLAAPVGVAATMLVHGRPRRPVRALSVDAVALCGSAVIVALLVARYWELAAAVPALAVVAVVCSRFPLAALVGVAVITASYGSTEAFLGFPSQKAVDVLLAGLWLAVIWAWTVGGSRGRPGQLVLSPWILVVAGFVLFTAAEIIVADHMVAALQSFRSSTWYLSIVVLAALAPWPPAVRRLLFDAVVLVALAAGAYATLRWAIGPAGAERALADRQPYNFLGGELRPVGSFPSAKALASWTAIAVPFMAAIALVSSGSRRALAAVACLLCVTGMVAADVRAGPAAAVAAVLVVIALHHASQAFRGVRGPAVAIAIGAIAMGGAGAFALTLGDKEGTGARYRAILEPADDPSYQARLVKWRAAMEDIDDAPFGHGLGTSGRAQQRYGDAPNIGSLGIDNSYLKIAYEQGFPGLALFAFGVLLLLWTLVRRAIASLEPARAGPAIAGAGALVAMLVLFMVGTYIEGQQALWGWLLVGLAASLSNPAPPDDDADAAG